MNLNKVILIGNITKDIEVKSLPSGISVTSFGLATNRKWKDKDGNKQEQAEFHNIIAFGKQAEVLKQYCSKGDQLFIEGRLQTRNWDKEDGTKAYRTEIILENFQFGNKAEKKETQTNTTLNDTFLTGTMYLQQKDEARPNEDVIDLDGRVLNPDDIPFN
jgi:single-strand DNA-binding protein